MDDFESIFSNIVRSYENFKTNMARLRVSRVVLPGNHGDFIRFVHLKLEKFKNSSRGRLQSKKHERHRERETAERFFNSSSLY